MRSTHTYFFQLLIFIELENRLIESKEEREKEMIFNLIKRKKNQLYCHHFASASRVFHLIQGMICKKEETKIIKCNFIKLN